MPSRRRIFLGTFATLLLVAALTPGIYPLLMNRSADRITAVSQDNPQDEPSAQLPQPTSSGPLPARYPAPAGLAGQSPVAPERTQALQQPPSAERKQLGRVTDASDKAAGLVPDRQLSPRPSASIAQRGRAPQTAAATPAIAGALSAAKPRVTEGDGFFVQLSAPKSEAEALSTLRTLRSKYAVLKEHEPVIRRKDEGERGVTYTVQVGPFESQDNADELCKQLKAAGGICFVTRN
jgi:cell division septation protein DedD